MLAATVVLLACSGCGDEAQDPEPRQVTAAEFVGAARCATCHADIADRHRGSHHDQAMQVATPETVLGDFAAEPFEHRGETTTFARDGDVFSVTTTGPNGTPETFRVAYTFGVEPLQQYLVELPGGRLQCLRVAWDSRPSADGGQRWFTLYPNEDIPAGDPLHWSGRNQNWNQMCAACHSTDLRKGYDRGADRYRTEWSDLNVACESCHGPGSNHVAWAEAGAADEQANGLPVDLSREGVRWVLADGAVTAHRQPAFDGQTAEVQTCAPCHSRRTELVEDSWHGKPFLDTYRPALLDEGLYHADGQILDEVYVWGSYVQSKMFHAGVTCSDCHDPHTSETYAQDNALCTRCHSAEHFDARSHHMHEPGSAGAACVECHMPETTYMVVDPRRDHSIRIPRPDSSESLGTPNACNRCHTDQDAKWATAAIDAHLEATGRDPEVLRRPHYGTAIALGRRGSSRAEPLLRALAEDASQPAIARATALQLLAERPSQTNIQTIAGLAEDPDPLVRFGSVAGLQNLPPAVRLQLGLPALYDSVRAVRVAAAGALADAPIGQLDPKARAQVSRALDEYEQSQRVNSDRAWGRVNLALALQQRGDVAGAEREYRAAIAQEPYAVRPYANLADLLRQRDAEEAAEAVLREGIEHAFETADLEHSLGLLLVRRGNKDAALAHLERASRQRPEEPRYAYVLAVAQVDSGMRDRGIATLEQAAARHPNDPDILAALANYEAQRGNRGGALQWAERLVELMPEDAGARQLRDSLRRR